MTLEESRKEIDRIDKELFSLFEKRMSVSDNIAKVKFEKKLPILNLSREEEVLAKAESAVKDEYSQYAREFCAYLMELSRTRQSEVTASLRPEVSEYEKELKAKRSEIKNPRVAVQGVAGSYASIAAIKMYPQAQLSYVTSWDDVMKALKNGDCDYGVLPVENSTAGSVIDVYDLLLNYKYSIVKALRLPVSHCLLAKKGTDINDIEEVFSHPHAFPQCRPFLEKHEKMKKVNVANTAVAAQTVAELNDKTKAAISSKECAGIYDLEVLAQDIQQTDDNCTRFVSVSTEKERQENADKISLILSLKHKTGSLYRLLSTFSLCGLNLTKIESRPDPKTPFEYYFYVDFIGSVEAAKTRDLLLRLKEELPFMYFLGNYSEIGNN